MNKFDKTHLKNLTAYQQKIADLYAAAAVDASKLSRLIRELGDSPLSWDDYPLAKAKMDAIIKQLTNDIDVAVVDGIKAEWELSNGKNDAICNKVFGTSASKLPKAAKQRYFGHNEGACEAFINRTRGGLNLSKSVWNYTDQFKGELEMALDLGIRQGKSADEISRDIRQYLKNPDKLFRRVRDEHGMLHLSKAAKNYHPGQGVYRSSYANARRLAATETNMAYRTADYERWQKMDFVVGIEVHLSNNHNCKGVPAGMFFDICDELKGKYPKDFKFTGWHPHCRCYATSILKTEAEMEADTARIMNGEEPTKESESKNYIGKDYSGNDSGIARFGSWVDQNEKRIEGAKSLPYFLSDNKAMIEGVKTATNNVPFAEDPSTVLERIATSVGAKCGSPMTFQEANEMRGNPNYAKSAIYKTNCQSSVVANELRRRGIDVEAFGNNKAEWYMPYELSKRPEAAWLTMSGKIPIPKTVKGGKNTSAIESAMKDEGRYHMWFKWNESNTGHMITAERLADGRIRYYDAQRGMSSFKFLYSFDEIDTSAGIRILKVDDLIPNERLITGIVKAAKSKAKAPRMTMDQISWWLENAQGATSFLGEFKPYSDEIIKQLKKCDTKTQRNNLLESVARRKETEVINDNGKAFTTRYPGHRSMKGETWKNTKQIAVDLNNQGMSVCFLPEYKDKISADAIVKVAGSWRLTDFKCSKSVKSNTIATDIEHAFEQAEHCVIKITNADKGIICEALDYLRRNNIQTGGFTFVNKYGKCKNITKSDLEQKRFWKQLKGFFR